MGKRESGLGQQPSATPAGELGELWVHLAAAESRLREQAAELARLRRDVELLHRLRLPEERPQLGAPRRPSRLVELVGLGDLPPRDSWLHRCEGFRVELSDGTVGTVEEVRYGSRYDRPDRLAVRVGRWRPQLLLVPVEEVDEIYPDEELVLLRASTSSSVTSANAP